MTKVFKGHCKKCGFESDVKYDSEGKQLFKTKGNCIKCHNLYMNSYMKNRYEKTGYIKGVGSKGIYWKTISKQIPIFVE
jgi:hypothetical protein